MPRTRVERELDNLGDWKEEDIKELTKRLLLKGYDDKSEARAKASLTPLEETKEDLEKWLKESGKTRGVTTGYWTLDRMTAGFCGGDLDVIAAPSSVGKCERKGTKILMADGTMKKIEDVEVGEYVQSEHGANRVIGKHNGFAKCYKITPVRGESFFVSQDHILTVRRYSSIHTTRKGKSVHLGVRKELIDVKIEDLLDAAYKGDWLSNYYLYRPEIRSYTEKKLPIPPYILGIWLGDGNSRDSAITSSDKEVIEAWLDYGEKEGCSVRESVRFNEKLGRDSKSKTYWLHTPRGQVNPILAKLELLGVRRNKHIPLEYLTGSWEQRMELLAGILDTDGYCKNEKGAYEVCQKNKQLAEDIVQLARGLGCGATIQIKKGTIDGRFVGEYFRMYISPGVEDIPCRVPRRKQSIEGKRTDPRNVGFRIDQVEDAEYYGIQVDGDHRFMLWDNTLTHNTLLCVNMMARQIVLGHKVVFITLEMSQREISQRLYSVMTPIYYEEFMREKPILVQEEYRIPYQSVEYVAEQAKAWGAEVIYIDHLHYFSRSMQNPAEGLGLITQEFKRVAIKYDIPIVLISQLRKTGGERPTGEDLRGSALIRQDADIVLILDRAEGIMRKDGVTDNVRVTLDKNRDRLIWRIGAEAILWKYGLDLREDAYDEIMDAGNDVTGKARGDDNVRINFAEE